MDANTLGGILPLVLIVLVFYLLVIRPARKRQQEMGRVQSSLQIGSEVMLSSGFYGTVISVGDDSVQLELNPGTTVKVARQAVVRVLDNTTEQPSEGETGQPNTTDEQ